MRHIWNLSKIWNLLQMLLPDCLIVNFWEDAACEILVIIEVTDSIYLCTVLLHLWLMYSEWTVLCKMLLSCTVPTSRDLV